jgi:SAM-dependent methyltransferase
LLSHVELRPNHKLLDIGAGPLCVGAPLIFWLRPGCYHALEPYYKVLDWGVKEFIPPSLLAHRRPVFRRESDFDLTKFQTDFDCILAYNVFVHCGVEQFKQCLVQVRKVLKPGGTFSVLLFIGDEDVEEGDKKPAYKFSSHKLVMYRLPTAQRLMEEHGLRIVATLQWFEYEKELVGAGCCKYESTMFRLERC